MKVSLFTTDEKCEDIVEFNVAHVSIFKENKISFHFLKYVEEGDMEKFIKACIKYFVLIEIQGYTVSIIPEPNNYQRIRIRFDGK